MTQIINLFGGPGVGKSTIASGIFFYLKQHRVSCELVTEYAKTLTWENRQATLQCQPYVFGKQLYSLEVLIDQVDVIVTDSPICLSLFYQAFKYPASFSQSVIDIFNSFDNYNYYIRREDDQYDDIGRMPNPDAAKEIDIKILKFLDTNYIDYKIVPRHFETAKLIAKEIMNHECNRRTETSFDRGY